VNEAVRAEDLGKRYVIDRRRLGAGTTFREMLTMKAKSAGKALVYPLASRTVARGGFQKREDLWALKDVSFEVAQGETLGIIGRNGAGKSTLLKVLSRITEPTTGRIRLKGRVASLLEVGTGFHPELTGRENIFLNGAILGMTKAEIKGKFDEIVDFAGIEKFLDTPVKRYSSGMYVRLAFAVAAHLEPEILVIDEVLAVGDMEFQKKCIGRMEKVSRTGRTVLLVSHNMSSIKALCTKALLLEKGKQLAVGSVSDVVSKYLQVQTADDAEKCIAEEHYVTEARTILVRRIRLLNSVGNSFRVHWRQPIHLSIEIETATTIEGASFGVGIRTMDGVHVFTVHHDDDGRQAQWTFEPGRHTVEVTLENDLRPGFYKLHVGAHQKYFGLKNLFAVEAVNIEVLDYAEDQMTPLASNSGLVNGKGVWMTPRAGFTVLPGANSA
jgi:lipopolysaccharide transport system ATP-binding protein